MLESIKNRIKEKLGVPAAPAILKLAHKNGFRPKVIYDIGAYKGEWTSDILEIFSASYFYMFEAQESKEACLRAVTDKNSSQLNYHISLLGAESGRVVTFNEYETASSVHSEYYKTEAVTTNRLLQTLDEVIQKRIWPLPDLIKLDTQGYEIEILKGENNAVVNTEDILMEVSVLEIYKGAPLFKVVVMQMSDWGFQVYDICALMRRPFKQALYQAVVLFFKGTPNLVASKKWA